MRLIGFSIIILMLLSSVAFSKTCIVHYPKTCKEITGTEYSTGGGKKIMVYLELDCKDSSGNYYKFIAEKKSVSGFLGLGRWTIPSKFEFKAWDKDRVDFGDGC